MIFALFRLENPTVILERKLQNLRIPQRLYDVIKWNIAG